MLEWELKLNARSFIDAANQGTAALGRLEAQIKQLESSTGGRAGDVFAGVFAADLVGKFAGGVRDAVGALKQMGDEVMRSMNERSAAIRAYTVLLGSATEAEKQFGMAQALAARTDLTSAQVEGAQKRLMVAGFRDQDLKAALLATTDVASMAAPGERAQAVDRVGLAFSQIRAKGKLQGEEIKQLDAYVGRDKIYAELVKAGFAKDAGGAEKAITKGQVDGASGIAAVERAILAQFSTKKLGEYSVGAAGTVSGLESNIGETWQNLAKSFKMEALPASELYRKSLERQAAALSLSTESGKNLTIVMQDFANSTLGVKSLWSEFSTGFLESFARTYTETLRSLGGVDGDAWKNAGTTMRSLGEVVGRLGSAAAHAMHFVERLAALLGKIGGAPSKAADAVTGAAGGAVKAAAAAAKEPDKTVSQGAWAVIKAIGAPAAAVEDYFIRQNTMPRDPATGEPLADKKKRLAREKGGEKGFGGDKSGRFDDGSLATMLRGDGGGEDGTATIRVERVEINVNGAGEPTQVAQLVYERFLAEVRSTHHAGR